LGVLSSGALAGAERSEGERSEPQRGAAAAKAGADSPLASRPDSEVVANPKRRTFTAEYKQRILTEAEAAAATPGGVGALLRREGLYSSLLAYWRRERADGIREALTPQKRGPKSKRNPLEEENQRLQRQNARLTEDLRKAHIIIDVQKKWLRCWGIRFRIRTQRRNPDGCRHRTCGGRGHQRCLPHSACASRFVLPGKTCRFFSGSARVATFAGTRTAVGRTRNGPGASSRRTLPGSLASRCLCHVAR